MIPPWRNAEGEPGEIVTAPVANPLEDPMSRGKRRPVVLVRREGSSWWVMGLTTNRSYRSGAPRTPVPNPRAVGLSRAGYLWGRLTRIAVLDVDRHIGWVDAELAAAIIVQARLDISDAALIIRAAADPPAAA